MKILEKLFLEKVTVSDLEYKITEVRVESGVEVNEGEVIFSFESSKADVDVESPSDGIVVHSLEVEQNVKPGELSVIIVDQATDDQIESLRQEYFKKSTAQDTQLNSNVRISKKAEQLISQNELSMDLFEGRTVIREKDVMEYLKPKRNSFDWSKLGRAKSNDVILIGAKGGAKMVIDAFKSNQQFQVKAILEDSKEAPVEIMGIPIIGGTNDLDKLRELGYLNLVLCFGNIFNRTNRYEKFLNLKNKGFFFPNVIHAQAMVETSVSMGEGNIILAGAIVGSEAKIGDLNYINTGAILSHESKLANNIHLAPGSTLGGRVSVGNNTLIGMNAVIYFDASIGSNTTINNGVVVNQDVSDNQLIK